MILGIGTDLTSIARIDKLIEKFGQKFLSKVFTKNEIIQAELKTNPETRLAFYAKRFAAKEAFSKAIGLGIGRGVDFCDIEIINDELGKPSISLINEKDFFVKNYFQQKKLFIDLSLSDEKEMALAFVVISAE